MIEVLAAIAGGLDDNDPSIARRLDRIEPIIPVFDGEITTTWAGALELDEQHISAPELLGGSIDRVGHRRSTDRRREHPLDVGRDPDDALVIVEADDLAEHRSPV